MKFGGANGVGLVKCLVDGSTYRIGEKLVIKIEMIKVVFGVITIIISRYKNRKYP